MKPHNIESREWVIYGLHDPADREIRYIGFATNIPRRLLRHIADARRGKDQTFRARWIRTLLAIGTIPELTVLQNGIGSGYALAERCWIADLRSAGHRLTNATDGGDGVVGHRHSEEVKRRISETLMGRRHSEEHRERSAAAHRALGRKVSAEQRAAISERSKARKLTPEQRERLTAALKARQWRPSEKEAERIGNLNRGRKFTDEERDNLSLKCSGRKHTPEERQKMRDAWATRKAGRAGFPEMARGEIAAALRKRFLGDRE